MDGVECFPGEKFGRLVSILTNNALESELVWNLFWSTCEHYKVDSLLRPFPKMYLKQRNEKMIQKLREVMMSVDLESVRNNSASADVMELVDWVVCCDGFKIRVVSRKDFLSILGKVQRVDQVKMGLGYIFEVDLQEKGSSRRFRELANRYGSRFAYHGSKLENYFSILHNGLQISLNKFGVFGPGVYLSSDLNVSLVFSPSGMGSPGSVFGDTFAIVALCEIVDHPDVKSTLGNGDSVSKYAFGKESTQIPNSYFLVQNSDMVEVRYLLVFPGYSRGSFQKNLSKLPKRGLVAFGLCLFTIFYHSKILRMFKNLF